MELEELKKSKDKLGEIYPVLKDQDGNILDGFHRKRADPNWKETTVEVRDKIHSLQIRLHANITRREIEPKEKADWIKEAREELQKQGKKGTQQEIADALDISQRWVSTYDPQPDTYHTSTPEEKDYTGGIISEGQVGSTQETLTPEPYELQRPEWKANFFGYNVWGFKDESWRNLIQEGDPNQPDVEFYHGATPAFVIHQLIKMFTPKKVLDNMAGTGTVGYVCSQYEGIKCDLYDLNPYPKYNVKKGDAENTPKEGKYDLIFNHLPYLNMVKYSETEGDMSLMKEEEFYTKLRKVFKHNTKLLSEGGIYAILIGDPRANKRVVPLTAKTTDIGLDNGLILWDTAVKLTTEGKNALLQEYSASKYGYLAPIYDTVLMFKKVE